MTDYVSERIANQLGVPDLSALLAEKLSGADLHSLLLAVIKRRVSKVEPSRLVEDSSVSKACDLDARLINMVECIAYAQAEEFDAIELSPVVPLGSVARLAGLDQGNVLSTIRAFECASDPTIGMALECVRRRKKNADRRETTKLCTSQRVLRFPQPDNPAFTSHFKLFAMVSAGRDSGSFTFELAALLEQIDFYLRVLSELSAGQFAFDDIVVELSDTIVVAALCAKFDIDRGTIRKMVRARDHDSSGKLLQQYADLWPKSLIGVDGDFAQLNLPQHLTERLKKLDEVVCQGLRSRYNNVRFKFNLHRLTGLSYYQGPCFHIKMKNQAGDSFMLADGGFVDWTQLLLGDNKERLMTSAIGTELICRLFQKQIQPGGGDN
ncbi:ATP phosphoribosyltransferase regulatory subunit [bacterium]|nr:ATP phosphoribosyltransferase regulatory subunit [bacterium]MBP9807132.1 ATP phosphoribosyltransferase regulatory subunit [bacterium]